MNVSDKSCRGNLNTHFVFTNFISENLAVHEVMWQNMVAARQVSGYNMIWRVRNACWITHDTDTHSECVMLFFFFFSRQQWLRDRSVVLRCTVHCLICTYWSCVWTCSLSPYLLLPRPLLGWWRNSVWCVCKTVCSSLCSLTQLHHTPTKASSHHPVRNTINTGLFEMIVGVLTTCHTQYTWDRSICIFYLIEQHPEFLLHTL